jgi:endonuclease/exonuclease/phosphatase family metal-dependent hydrolase
MQSCSWPPILARHQPHPRKFGANVALSATFAPNFGLGLGLGLGFRATLGVVDIADSSTWCVLTWNLQGSQGPDIDAVAAAIRAESPDIVVIQEIRKGQAGSLGAALSMRYSWALKHSPYTTAMWWRSEGMAIMTPHLLDAAGHTEVSDEQPMRSWRRRIAQWALIGRPDRSMVMIYNLHLSPHEDADSRRSEAARVSEIVAAIGHDSPVVVAGDFNDADDPTIVDALPGVEHVAPSNTNPSQQPTQLLDHVLLPADATDVSASVPSGGTDWVAISDHLPVTVRFTLRNVGAGA